MATCDPQALVNAGACFYGLSPKQVGMVSLALLCRIWQASNPMANCDINDLMYDARCFAGLPMNEQMAIQLQLLCEILNGGGTGATCIIGCAASGPAVAGPCPFSIAYSPSPNSGVWLWNEASSTWEEIIAPGP